MSFFSLFSNRKSSGIFVPDGSQFKELIDSIPDKTINNVAIHLGYNPDQVRTIFGDLGGDDDIQCASVEIFTRNIVFVCTKSTVLHLSKNKVDYFFRHFKLEEEFNSYKTEDILKEGINNKSLRIEFLARVLDIKNPEPDGIFNVPSLALNLFFSNGFLVDYNSGDGLNEWAKSWKQINPKFIESYKQEAEHYWEGDVSKVFKEINTQADAYANIPNGLRNPFIDIHKNKFGNINFVMLMVCHYNKIISMNEFTEINHGRYKILNQAEGIKVFQSGKFTYKFSSAGYLLDHFMSN